MCNAKESTRFACMIDAILNAMFPSAFRCMYFAMIIIFSILYEMFTVRMGLSVVHKHGEKSVSKNSNSIEWDFFNYW